MKANILVVDDESAILDSLCPFLARAGFEVETAQDGAHALQILQHFAPDVIVLDVVMPHIDGRQLLRKLRDQKNWVPVILLTAVGDATERAMAITEGADDYLNKPYNPHELIARIGSVLRRTAQGSTNLKRSPQLKAGSITYDHDSHIFKKEGQKLNLTPRASRLLEYLMRHPGEVLTRDRLLNAVWGYEFATGSRSVDSRILELRKALDDDSQNPEYIETVSREGYRFVANTEIQNDF